MSCFLCLKGLQYDCNYVEVSLTRILKHIKVSHRDYELYRNEYDHTGDKTVICCESCGDISNKLSSLIEEMEVIQMKTMYQLSEFEKVIQVKNNQTIESNDTDCTYLKTMTKEQCLKTLKTSKTPKVLVCDPDWLCKYENGYIFYLCSYCGPSTAAKRFCTKTAMETHMFHRHLQDIFRNDRPRGMSSTLFKKFVEHFIEKEVFSSTSIGQRDKFADCYCSFCQCSFLNQNEYYYHLLRKHQTELSKKLGPAVQDHFQSQIELTNYEKYLKENEEQSIEEQDNLSVEMEIESDELIKCSYCPDKNQFKNAWILEQHQMAFHLDSILEQARFPVVSFNLFRKLCGDVMKSEQGNCKVGVKRKRIEWRKCNYCPSQFDNWYKLYFHVCSNHRSKLLELVEQEQKNLIIRLICKNNERILRFERENQQSTKPSYDSTEPTTDSTKVDVEIKIEPDQINKIKIEHDEYDNYEATKLLMLLCVLLG